MSKKLLIPVVLAVAAILVAGYAWAKKGQNKNNTTKNENVVTSANVNTADNTSIGSHQGSPANTENTDQAPQPQVVIESSHKIYKNSSYGFSFEYPKDWDLRVNEGRKNSGTPVLDFILKVKPESGITGQEFATIFQLLAYRKGNVNFAQWLRDNDEIFMGDVLFGGNYDLRKYDFSSNVSGLQPCQGSECVPPLFESRGWVFRYVEGQDSDVFKGYASGSVSYLDLMKTLKVF